MSPPAAASRGDAEALGQYVRARLADRAGAPEQAVANYAVLLGQAPDNPALALHAYRSGLAAGDIALATRAAHLLDARGALPVEGRLLLFAETIAAEDWPAARRTIARIEEDGAFDFVAPVLRAWVNFAAGEGAMIELLDGKAGSGLGAPYDREHRALLLLALGRVDEGLAALQALGGPAEGFAADAVRISAARSLRALGRRREATELLSGDAPVFRAARASLSKRQKRGNNAAAARSGVALLLARLADDISRQRATPLALSIARIAGRLDPENDGIRLIAAERLGATGRTAGALAMLDRVDPRGAWIEPARDARLIMLVAQGRNDAALAAAREATARPGATSEDFSRLGEVQTALGRHAEAAASYDRAIVLTEREGGTVSWMQWLLKGSAHEAAGDWEAARPALERAVALAPDQAVALNYLGYAQLERRENLAAAEALIRRASALSPNDSSITDSLGWAYFLRGNISKAVETLEKAVVGQPGEPVINEHLGDAYWAAGRRIEARYAWRAALPHAEAEDAGRIRAKLDFGPPVASP